MPITILRESPLIPPKKGETRGREVSRININNGAKEEVMILVAGPVNELGYEICHIMASQGKSIRTLVLDSSDLAWAERLKNFGATMEVGDLYDPVFLADACVGVEAVICSPILLPYNSQPVESRF
jgi:hypothetical protein